MSYALQEQAQRLLPDRDEEAAYEGIPVSEADTDESEPLPALAEKPLARWRFTCLTIPRPNPAAIFWALLPSFVSRCFGKSDVPLTKPDSTSYLTGLRGIASLIVAIQHQTNQYFLENHGCYGDGPPEADHIVQLPFIRLILHGSFMVAIFFVISGFALTYGPLKRMHAGNPDAALAGLPSSVFRRPLRLFLPIVPVVLASMVVLHFFGFYGVRSNGFIPPQATIWTEISIYFHGFFIMTASPTGLPPLPQAWTLYTEYQGSLLVFLGCLAFARVSPGVRMAFMMAVVWYMQYIAHWEMALFAWGMILADLRHLREKLPEASRAVRRVIAGGSWFLVIAAWFFGPWPIEGNLDLCYGYNLFNHLPTGNVPQSRFWHALSAAMLVLALENLPVLQRLLNARPILYLGDISYGIYLVHWFVMYSYPIKTFILHLIHSGYNYLGSWACGFSIAITMTFWIGDLHWRFADRKSVALARWISDKVGV